MYSQNPRKGIHKLGFSLQCISFKNDVTFILLLGVSFMVLTCQETIEALKGLSHEMDSAFDDMHGPK